MHVKSTSTLFHVLVQSFFQLLFVWISIVPSDGLLSVLKRSGNTDERNNAKYMYISRGPLKDSTNFNYFADDCPKYVLSFKCLPILGVLET